MSFKTIFQDTSSGNAIRQYFDTKFAAIESRLESIERMLGEEKPLSPSEYKAIWHGEVEQEPEWTTGAPKENKMVRVSVPGNDERWVGHITKDGGWNIYSLNSAIDTVVPFYRSRKRINQWRELTEEENTLCWERGILGASEEHAELSTLELPIDKHEPEWRPMSTAPSNGLIQAKIKSNGNIIKIVQKYGLWVEDDYYLYRPDVFEGWRPL